MKTQIIALEAHDDFISVRDRMSWAKSPRILLVWPKSEKITLRPADLRILQQHASFLGAEMGIITRRGEVRRDAERFGIPVFGSAAAAQRQAWKPRRPLSPVSPEGGRRSRHELEAMRDAARGEEMRWMSRPLFRVGFFLIGVLAVLAIAAVFVPEATITLTPASQQQSFRLPISASKSTQGVSLAQGIPTHEITVTISGSQAAYVTTQSSIPDSKASGVARFTNLSQSGVTIPAGTIVYSLSPTAAQFVTANDTHLAGSVNAIVEVPIVAVEGGAKSNLPANAIQLTEGSLALSVAVTNPEPTQGGTDRVTAAPSDADRQRLRDVVVGLMRSQAQAQAADSIGAGDLLLADTLTIGQVQEETYDPPAGKPGNLLKLHMRADFSVQYVRAEDLNQLAEATLNSSVPASFSPVPGSLSVQVVGAPTVDASGAAQLELQLSRRLVRDVDLSQAIALVRGQSPSIAAALLRADLPLAAPPLVDLQPAWWPWLPMVPFRITVINAQ